MKAFNVVVAFNKDLIDWQNKVFYHTSLCPLYITELEIHGFPNP